MAQQEERSRGALPPWASDPFRERYEHDPVVYAAVTSMRGILVQGMLPVADLARCAVLAAQLYAERYASPVMLRIEDHDLTMYELMVGRSHRHGQEKP